jgi:hypothetical protein
MLYLGNGYIMFVTVVQQPIKAILFALVLHSLIHQLRDSCRLLLHAWYLDGETLVGGFRIGG